MYYWRTTFKLSDPERKFLSDNNIERLYVRFFDVVEDNGELRPEATLLFEDSLPNHCTIIPTVFIDARALQQCTFPDNFASMLIDRVDAMLTKNGYDVADEIQMDFDWTMSNREHYFNLLKTMRDKLHATSRRLSTTIRLHQLSQPAPPADCGVLMLYNVGRFADVAEENSILNTATVRQYLKYLPDYDLPLSTALPIYHWDLLFRGDKFMVIARGMDVSDTSDFVQVDANHYVARRYMSIPGPNSAVSGNRILPGDVVRHEQVSVALIDSVLNMVRDQRPDALNSIILYHLDDNSLKKYNPHEISKIFSNR